MLMNVEILHVSGTCSVLDVHQLGIHTRVPSRGSRSDFLSPPVDQGIFGVLDKSFVPIGHSLSAKTCIFASSSIEFKRFRICMLLASDIE